MPRDKLHESDAAMLNDPEFEEEIVEILNIIENINDDKVVAEHTEVNTDSSGNDR